MQIDMLPLTFEGDPGEEVKIFYRDRSADPPPPIYEGKIGPDGSLTVVVPRAYLVVLSHNQTIPLDLCHATEPCRTVQLNADTEGLPDDEA